MKTSRALQNTIAPTVSHSKGLSRWGMLRWKIKLYRTFYSTPLANTPRSGFFASTWRALSGLVKESHESKLQTVFRVAAVSAWDVLRLSLTRGWMTRREERELFSTWDDTFRRIRQQLDQNEAFTPVPEDTTTLHQANVMERLRPIHAAARSLVRPG